MVKRKKTEKGKERKKKGRREKRRRRTKEGRRKHLKPKLRFLSLFLIQPVKPASPQLTGTGKEGTPSLPSFLLREEGATKRCLVKLNVYYK